MIRDKLAIVTGANGGIGIAVAGRLWAEGYALALFRNAGRDRLAAFAAERGGFSADLLELACDLRDMSSIRRCLDAPELQRPVGALVNNAGMFLRQELLEVSDADFQTVMAVNLQSCLVLMQWAASRMKEGGGAIVNIASATGTVPVPNLGVYSVAKAGLIMLTRLAAQEWGALGIRVNTVSPGLIRTPMTQRAYDDPAEREHRTRMAATGRVGEAEDVVGMVAFLCSAEAAFITGQNVVIDGGAHDGLLRFLHAARQ